MINIIASRDIDRTIIPTDFDKIVEDFINNDINSAINELIKTPVKRSELVNQIWLKIPENITQYKVFETHVLKLLLPFGYRFYVRSDGQACLTWD